MVTAEKESEREREREREGEERRPMSSNMHE